MHILIAATPKSPTGIGQFANRYWPIRQPVLANSPTGIDQNTNRYWPNQQPVLTKSPTIEPRNELAIWSIPVGNLALMVTGMSYNSTHVLVTYFFGTTKSIVQKICRFQKICRTPVGYRYDSQSKTITKGRGICKRNGPCCRCDRPKSMWLTWHEIHYSCQILKSNDASIASLRSCHLLCCLPLPLVLLHEVVIEA